MGKPQCPEVRRSGPLSLHKWKYLHADDSRVGRAFGVAMTDFTGDGYADIVSGKYFYRNPGTDMLGKWERSELPIEGGDALLAFDADADIMPDVIAMPIGQGHSEYGRYAKDRGVNPIEILSPEVEATTGNLASSATRVNVVATGGHVTLVKTSGNSRDLGRSIVQSTGGSGVEVSSATANRISATEVTT